jgi:hypothetical protein
VQCKPTHQPPVPRRQRRTSSAACPRRSRGAPRSPGRRRRIPTAPGTRSPPAGTRTPAGRRGAGVRTRSAAARRARGPAATWGRARPGPDARRQRSWSSSPSTAARSASRVSPRASTSSLTGWRPREGQPRKALRRRSCGYRSVPTGPRRRAAAPAHPPGRAGGARRLRRPPPAARRCPAGGLLAAPSATCWSTLPAGPRTPGSCGGCAPIPPGSTT